MTNLPEIQAIAASLPPLAVAPGEAARLMGIGRTLVYEEIASTRLRSAKIGKRRLITIEAIKDWLKAREAENASSEGYGQ
ncbi:excisionase family DNA-binding protein [Alphaproteobacteria bacterium]|nr:excisionase family DNA-binding protein [Alphaproteobacteria bacterium]